MWSLLSDKKHGRPELLRRKLIFIWNEISQISFPWHPSWTNLEVQFKIDWQQINATWKYDYQNIKECPQVWVITNMEESMEYAIYIWSILGASALALICYLKVRRNYL